LVFACATCTAALALEAPETLAPGQVSDTTALLSGVLNPHVAELAAGAFVYAEGSECAAVGAQETPEQEEREREARQFSAQLDGLTAGKTYTVCAVAMNSEGARVLGQPRSFQTETAGPEVSAVIEHLTNESVTLRVTVSTHGEPGSLSVRYGTTLSYGSESEPRKLAPAPNPVEETVTLPGLEAATRYHFHVVVSTALPGEVSGSDMTVVTQATPVPGLPDKRRAELVTPLNGNDQGVAVPLLGKGFEESDGAETTLPFAVSEDGGRVAYVAGPVPGGSGSNGLGELGNQFLASRANGHWENQVLTPAGYYSARYEAFNPTLEIGILNIAREETLPPVVPQAPDNTNVLYTKALPAGAFTPLFTETPAHYLDTNGGEYEGEHSPLFFGGASEDFKTLLFSADGVLGSNAVEPAEEGDDNLYVSNSGRVEAVNVLPGQAVSTPDATFGGPSFPNPVERGSGPNLDHVISADGTRVLWTDLVNHDLYMRVDPLTSEAHTVQVDLAAGGGGEFWAANREDSEVLFTKSGDLYDYNADTGVTADIVPGGEVVGVLGASEVGPLHVYFVARAALTAESTPVSCDPASESRATREESLCNLYEYTPEHGPKLITQLEANDGVGTPPYLEGGGYISAGDWQSDLGSRTAEISPDGDNLLFTSQARIHTESDPAGYDNDSFSEVYLYSSETGETTCLSCGTEGQPLEAISTTGETDDGGYLPISSQDTFQPRLMSANGRRVFFESSQALSPLDTNGHTDVYEWEADEEGSCKLAEGCVSLLSDGTSPSSSFLIGASASGDDVFVSSRAPLAGQQLAGDGVAQLYDLRVGGAEESGGSSALGDCAQRAQCSFGAEGLAAVVRPATETTEAVGDFPAVQPVAAPKVVKKTKSKPKRSKVKRCRRPSRLNKQHKCVAPRPQRSRRHGS
jgi:hypothetical protein